MPLEASIKSSLPPNPKTPSADDSPSLGMISPLGGAPPPGGGAWTPDAQMMMFAGGMWVIGQSAGSCFVMATGGGGRGFGGRFPGMPIPDRGSFRRYVCMYVCACVARYVCVCVAKELCART